MIRFAWMLLLLAFALPAGAAEAPPMKSILLVAHRSLADPFFRETVVLVTHLTGRQPMGIILNRPTQVPLAQALSGADALASHPDAKLFFGGPVSRDRLVFVFRAAAPPAEALALYDGVYMSWNRELLMELLGRDDPLDGLRVFAGHAGWAPGQLESEVARGDWHLSPVEAGAVFEKRPEELWTRLERRASSQRIRHPGAGRPPARPTPVSASRSTASAPAARTCAHP